MTIQEAIRAHLFVALFAICGGALIFSSVGFAVYWGAGLAVAGWKYAPTLQPFILYAIAFGSVGVVSVVASLRLPLPQR